MGYDKACEEIDGWRRGLPLGRRVLVSCWVLRGVGDEYRAFATERARFIAEGRGATREAACVALAAMLPRAMAVAS